MTQICREIPVTGVEHAVPSTQCRHSKVSSSLQSLRPLHAMRAMRAMPALHTMHAMQRGRGGCNDATTSTKVMDRVEESQSELVRSTHLSLVRRCRR
jgi:hypothetical protein